VTDTSGRDWPTNPTARISAALAIHTPCHTAQSEPFACMYCHWDDEGRPDGQPAVCLSCTYDDRTVTYPCPTALALGVTTEGGQA
jgi:hypothetical protein